MHLERRAVHVERSPVRAGRFAVRDTTLPANSGSDSAFRRPPQQRIGIG